MRVYLQKKSNETHRGRALTAFVLVLVLAVSMASPSWASALYILTGVDDTAIVLDGKQAIPDLSDRMIHVTSGNRGYDVVLEAGLSVTIHWNGTTRLAFSEKETVSALLKRMDIVPSPLEMVGVHVAENHVTLTVAEEVICYERVTEIAPYSTVRVANPDLPEGAEQVVQEGVDGERTAIYEVVWSGGEVLSRQFVEEVESTAVDCIVEYGTDAFTIGSQEPIANVAKNEDGSGMLTLADGTTLKFTEAKSMTATAYTAGHGGADYVTATGSVVGIGTVAVDKRVIPLGTRMYIVTKDGIVYGMSVACDTGVRGNVIDLYHSTYKDCMEFGRRSCTVYILE